MPQPAPTPPPRPEPETGGLVRDKEETLTHTSEELAE